MSVLTVLSGWLRGRCARQARDDKSEDNGIFSIPARRCLRCGGLLTSEQGLRDGYGHVCKAKAEGRRTENEPLPGQVTFEALLGYENRKEE